METGVFSSPSDVLRHADATDGTRIYDALDARVSRRVEQVTGAVHIRAEEFFGMPGPQTVIGGDMEDKSASGDSSVTIRDPVSRQ